MLTKSEYLAGLSCKRYLWFLHNNQLQKPSLYEKQRMSSGYEFQSLVHQLFPDAKKNTFDPKVSTIYLEAPIQINDLFVRADLLIPNLDSFDLIEIKASCSVKSEHIVDLAFQKHVFELANVKIGNCFVYHLNKDYIKKDKLDINSLVKIVNVTNKVNKIKIDTKEFLKIINNNTPPNTCQNPKSCPCPKEEYSILHLKDYRTYYDQGIRQLNELTETLKGKDEIIRQANIKNQPIINKNEINEFIKNLNYPLYHFDFETIDQAIPMYNNSRPWQKIPFQYSLHIQDNTITHHEYLGEPFTDPRINLLKQLKKNIGKKGDIIVYHAVFETTILKELKRDFPEYEELIDNMLSRIKDLALPFKEGYYYNKEQKGSYSLKAVLPALCNKGYKHLEINNGGDASVTYYLSHYKQEIPLTDRLRNNLLEYCKLDTEAMILIIKQLETL